MAEDYLTLIERDDFAEAAQLWDAQAAPAAAAIRRDFAKYATFTTSTEFATEVSTVNALQYVTVGARIDGRLRADGKPMRESGNILLRRPASRPGTDAPDGGWRIWGTDIRAR